MFGRLFSRVCGKGSGEGICFSGSEGRRSLAGLSRLRCSRTGVSRRIRKNLNPRKIFSYRRLLGKELLIIASSLWRGQGTHRLLLVCSCLYWGDCTHVKCYLWLRCTVSHAKSRGEGDDGGFEGLERCDCGGPYTGSELEGI